MAQFIPSDRSCLFVLSGGGMPGLDIHAGILSALARRDIAPTAVCGTSAGAIIGAFLAAGRTPANIAAIVASLDDDDVRSERLLWKLRIPWLDSFLDNAPIRRLLADLLPASWSDMSIPFQAWATELLSGASVNVAHPSIAATPADAVLASMSICGVFPPVCLKDGREYVDGGVRRNLPLPQDFHRYNEVYLLIASQRPKDYRKQTGILTHLLRNVQYLMLDQIEDVFDEVRSDILPGCQLSRRPTVHVLWPDVRVERGALHFDHQLMDKAAQITDILLNDRGDSTFRPIPIKETRSC